MVGGDQLDLFPSGQTSTARISPCERFRYELTRRWADGPLLEWVMLNPSTADADQDDPTIRRCIGFAKAWGFNGIRVTNLFPLRATDPKELLTAASLGINDPEQQQALSEEQGPITVCAWGSHPLSTNRLQPHTCWDGITHRSALMCLGYNKDGSPKHPLYVKANTGLRPWPAPDPKQRWY